MTTILPIVQSFLSCCKFAYRRFYRVAKWTYEQHQPRQQKILPKYRNTKMKMGSKNPCKYLRRARVRIRCCCCCYCCYRRVLFRWIRCAKMPFRCDPALLLSPGFHPLVPASRPSVRPDIVTGCWTAWAVDGGSEASGPKGRPDFGIGRVMKEVGFWLHFSYGVFCFVFISVVDVSICFPRSVWR